MYLHNCFEAVMGAPELRGVWSYRDHWRTRPLGFVLAQMVKNEGSLIPSFDSGTYVIDAVDSEFEKIFSKFFEILEIFDEIFRKTAKIEKRYRDLQSS